MKEILNKGRFKIQVEQIKEVGDKIKVYGYTFEAPLICTKKQLQKYGFAVDDIIQGKYKNTENENILMEVSPVGTKNPHCLLMTNMTELLVEKYKHKLGLKLPDLFEAFVDGKIEAYFDEKTGTKEVRFKGTK